MPTYLQDAQTLFTFTQRTRRDLHRQPELGFQEYRTAGIVADELTRLGLEVTSGVAKTGVVGLLEGRAPGPVVLLRFDMDALPIDEQTGADYASQTPGVMHACGHDAHVAIGLTVARMLHTRREQFAGAFKFMFQPAEEGLGGAEGMLAAGVLENPRVDRALSLHVWNDCPVGWLGIPDGALMAGGDIFDIRIHGKGGHGALPQNTIDPINAAAQIITALQTIVSRNVSPLDTAVVSVGRVRAGDAFNVIPSSAELSGTLRTFSPAVRQQVVERLHAICEGVAAGLGCRAEVTVNRLTPALINDPATAEIVRAAARAALPADTLDTSYRLMVSEDMAYLMEQVPGCYLLVGANNPSTAPFGHHHPQFDIDEGVLPRAAAVMTAAALELIGTLAK